MKKLIYCVLALLPAFLIIQGCNKLNDTVVTAGGTLKVQKTEVMINEPDTLGITDAKASDKIVWLVSPAGSNTISTSGGGAALTFSKSGTYTVTATVNDGKALTATIVVNSSVYAAPAGTTPTLLTGDQISLTPGLYKSAAADTTYIYFNAHTTNTYCATNRLNISSSITSGNYVANFINVLPYGTCTGTMATLHAGINFRQTPTVLANGTYPLTLNLNGTAYTGSIVVSTANITFNWNYTAGVVLTNKTIVR